MKEIAVLPGPEISLGGIYTILTPRIALVEGSMASTREVCELPSRSTDVGVKANGRSADYKPRIAGLVCFGISPATRTTEGHGC